MNLSQYALRLSVSVRGFSKRKRKCFISYRRLLKKKHPSLSSVNAAKLVLLRYKDPQRQAKEENENWERGGMRWQHGLDGIKNRT
jgi:hypothetical protein